MAESVVGPNLNDIAEELKNLTNEEIKNRIRMLDNNIKQYKLEMNKINSDMKKVYFFSSPGPIRTPGQQK